MSLNPDTIKTDARLRKTTVTIGTFRRVGLIDGYLLGYIYETPMAKPLGEAPHLVADSDAYGGWHVQRFGVERFWVDPSGQIQDGR